jgi:hypothetical protein
MQFDQLRRREFITLLGGVVAWPLAAQGQQSERVRLIGMLLPIAKDDRDYLNWITDFRQALQELGWVEGRNVRIDIRWGPKPPICGDRRRNWPRSHRTLFWLMVPRR